MPTGEKKISQMNPIAEAIASSFLQLVQNGVNVRIAVSDFLKTHIAKSDTGLLTTLEVSMPSFPLTTSFSKVGIFGAKDIDKSNGHFDLLDNTLTAKTAGVSSILVCCTIAIDNNVDLELSFYKNGQPVSNNNPKFVGRGAANPFQAVCNFVQNAAADDTLEVWAKASAPATLVLYRCASTIRREKYD